MDDTMNVEALPTQQGMRLCTSKLVDLLKDGKAGDIVTDEQMEQACGRCTQVGGKGYQNLQTAIRHVIQEYHVVWRRQEGANCIKCLGSEEIVQVVGNTRRNMERAAKRVLLIANSADVNQLDGSQKARLLALTAQFSAVPIFLHRDTTKKLEARQIGPLSDNKKLLDAFLGISKGEGGEK